MTTLEKNNDTTPTVDTSQRCDRCGAQAYVTVLLGESGHELQFCGNHWDRYEHVLTGDGNVVDRTPLDAFRNQAEGRV